MFTMASRHNAARNVSGQAGITPMMEMLEGRQLLSATVAYTPTSITVKTDQFADSILIDNSGPGGTYNVTGNAGTGIISTGTPPAAMSTGVSIKVISSNLKNNDIMIRDVTAKDVSVKMGGGNDSIYIHDGVTIARNLTISTGNGINTVQLFSGTIAGATKITGGRDGDAIYLAAGNFADLTFGGAFSVTTGAGVDYIGVGAMSVVAPKIVFDGAVKLDAGIGDDIVDLCSVSVAGAGSVRFANDLSIKLGVGADRFNVNAFDSTNTVSVERNFLLDLGAGNDTTGGMPAGHLIFQPGGTTRAKTVIKSGPGVKSQSLLTGLLSAVWNTGRSVTFNW